MQRGKGCQGEGDGDGGRGGAEGEAINGGGSGEEGVFGQAEERGEVEARSVWVSPTCVSKIEPRPKENKMIKER